MSVKVELADLEQALADLGSTCFLLTTNEDSSPHPANVRVEFADGRFTASAGRRSCRNSGERPIVTLLWPANGASDMSLLVDGRATVAGGAAAEGGAVTIEPTSAIWHRQPD